MKNEYTFFSLLNANNFDKIEIPRIQRSYAQGRKNEKIVRNSFLDSIIRTLEYKKSTRLCLDFIYGENIDNKFIPIDGQQRLTTLYLLYWYLNNFEKNADEKEKRKEILGKFTYETRESSKEFCERLSRTSININYLENNESSKDDDDDKCISAMIKNQTWYLIQWKDDPTIKAMLNMLDAIEEKLKDKNIEEIKTNAFEQDGKKIYFYFIEVKTFGSADDLYVKMNSRGKKLTTFENFKSKLEDYMNKEILKENDKKLLDTFKRKIDNEWLLFFWNIIKEAENENKAEELDRCLMNLFETIYENKMALTPLDKSNDKKKNEIKEKLIKEIEKYDIFISKGEEERKIDFEKLKEQKVIDEETVKYSYYVLEYYSILQDNEKISRKSSEVINYEEIVDYKEIAKKMINFSGSTKNDFRSEKIEFYIICKYLYKICEREKDKELKDIIKEDNNQEKLTEILYFARNIVKNVYIDSEEKYCNMIKFMDKIIEEMFNENSIFEYLKNLEIEKFMENIKIENEVKYLLQGEKKKAEKICSNIEWKKIIKEIDKNKYFTGNTQFIFEFVENKQSESPNTNELVEYKKYVTLINKIFGDTENNEDTVSEKDMKDSKNSAKIDPILDNDKYYLKRALFTIGNYMFKFNKRYSYLICSDKYQSWKKMLTGEKNGTSKEVFRKLLDKVANEYNGNIEKIRTTDIECIIKSIVKKYEDNNIPSYGIGKWREYIIRYPKLIGVVKEKTNSSKLGFLKVTNDDLDNAKDIIIIKNVNKSQTSWSFYTYALKCRIEDDKICKKILKQNNIELRYQPNSHEENKYIIYESEKYGNIGLIYTDLKKDDTLSKCQYAYYIKAENDLSKILEKYDHVEITLQDDNKYYFYKYDIKQANERTEQIKNAEIAEQEIINDFGKLLK